MKTVIINADDYAQSAAIDAAILDLADRGIVTAASAMTLSFCWPEAAKAAAALKGKADLGLHLDFTSPFARKAAFGLGLSELIVRSFAGALPAAPIRYSIARQLDAFEDGIGSAPFFIDGHQHAHQLPQIREALISELIARYGEKARAIAFRISRPAAFTGVKPKIIELCGANGFANLLGARGFSTVTSDFLGVYGFSKAEDLHRLWHTWLSAAQGPSAMVMCHPARGEAGAADRGDPIFPARQREYAWLSSAAFAELCGVLDVTPARWPSL